MKCVVTGGAGFIGRAVVSNLAARGFGVLVFDPEATAACGGCGNVEWHPGDVRDLVQLSSALAGADLVFHLSGMLGTSELFDDPARAIDVNIKGALNVLLAAREQAVRRVFLPTKPNGWNNVYSVTAQAVEKLGQAYRECMGLDVRILRVLNVYGPGQAIAPVRKAVPLFIAQAIAGRPLQIYGDGSQVVALQYVSDVAAQVVDYMLADCDVTQTHEVRAAAHLSVRALAERVVSITASPSSLRFQPMRRGEQAQAMAAPLPDVVGVTGGMDTTPLDEGLRDTIAWYRRLDPSALAAARRFHATQG